LLTPDRKSLATSDCGSYPVTAREPLLLVAARYFSFQARRSSMAHTSFITGTKRKPTGHARHQVHRLVVLCPTYRRQLPRSCPLIAISLSSFEFAQKPQTLSFLCLVTGTAFAPLLLAVRLLHVPLRTVQALASMPNISGERQEAESCSTSTPFVVPISGADMYVGDTKRPNPQPPQVKPLQQS
jgi:hypothetical protein